MKGTTNQTSSDTATRPAALSRARRLALDAGLNYVYTGNVHDQEGDTTFCPGCRKPVVVRDWYEIIGYQLTDDGHCRYCGHAIAGRYEKYEKPFGARRIPVRMRE